MEMNGRTVIALITLLLLLLAEQLTYGLFYSDLSFITASFFPDVGNVKDKLRSRWTRRNSGITRDTSWAPSIWVSFRVVFSGGGLQIATEDGNRSWLSSCVKAHLCSVTSSGLSLRVCIRLYPKLLRGGRPTFRLGVLWWSLRAHQNTRRRL